LIADLFAVKNAGEKGKGLFATQSIPKGTIIHFLCKNCGVYSKEELARLPKKEFEFVRWHEITAASGRLTNSCDKRILYLNHSCNSNILRVGKRFKFDIVVRDIKRGEEATEDYRIFLKELHFTRGCGCGEKGCMGKTTFGRPTPKGLQKSWDNKANGAVKRIPCVEQPLKGKLLGEHPGLSYLFNK